MKVSLFLLLTAICATLSAESVADVPANILEQYSAATRGQEDALKGASMEVEMTATLPSMKKQGRLHALRRITDLGRITYEVLKFEGDGTVKNQVIARYLTTEVEAQKEQAPSLAVTPDNYKFKYKGRKPADDGREVHVFEVSPKKKTLGTYKGELWIDAETYLRVQESGTLVKTPSFFLKKVAFLRKYVIRDGVSVPQQVQSFADVRMVGKAELTIDYTNVALDSTKRAGAAESDIQ